MSKYTIGIDFGTLSGRAVLVDVSDGREVTDCVLNYPHAVMDETLAATGEKLPVTCSFTERQKDILKAGGLLAFTRSNI